MHRFAPPIVLAIALVFPLATATQADALAEAEDLVRRATAEAGIERHAETLIRLAWQDEYGPDSAVSQVAKRFLVERFITDYASLGGALRVVPRERQVEVVDVLIRGAQAHNGIIPGDYWSALNDAIWYGTLGARELAIPQFVNKPNPAVLLPMIDAAIEHPELVPTVIDTLAAMRDDRARYWLGTLLHSGDAPIRSRAAIALARIGGRARGPLHEALHSDERDTRLTAARALLPIASIEDLSALYEYYGNHPDDDDATLEAVLQTALRLELMLQEHDLGDASGPLPGD